MRKNNLPLSAALLSLVWFAACKPVVKKSEYPPFHMDSKTAETLLQGSWWGQNPDHADFSIEGDTICGIDDPVRNKYVIRHDTLSLITKEQQSPAIILCLTKDSLIEEDVLTHMISRNWKKK